MTNLTIASRPCPSDGCVANDLPDHVRGWDSGGSDSLQVQPDVVVMDI
jgi:hypothetical protein